MSGQTPPGGADPSMDDILASIRKILNEDDPSAATQPPRPPAAPEVIQLTPEMMVTPPESLAGPAPAPQLAPLPALPTPPPTPPPLGPVAPVRVPTNIMQSLSAPPLAAQPEPAPMPSEVPAAALVDPLAAAAAAAALGQLSRAVAQERTSAVTRGGPSIEDVVREELRPMLKAWLDAHLPATVERMVRTEIERVMARQG